MNTEDTIPQDGRDPARGDTPRQDAPNRSEPREDPSRGSRAITDADRAANPLGVARREREQRERDEAGRFASKGKDQPQAKPEGQETGDKPDDGPTDRQQPGQVPPGALRAERDKRQTAERKLEQLEREMAEMRGMMMGRQQGTPPAPKPQAEAPEWFVDPTARVQHEARALIDPLQRRFDDFRMQTSVSIARQTFGNEVVEEVMQELAHLSRANPAAYQQIEARFGNSHDPFGDLVRWRKQQSAMQRYGDDPEAYVKAEVERRLAEMQSQHGGDDHRQPFTHAPPAAERQPVAQQPLPSSFAAQRGGGPRGGQAYGGPKSLSEMMGR